MKHAALVVVLGMLAVACGNDVAADDAAGACAITAPDCADTVTPLPGEDSTPRSAVPVEEAVSAGIDGGLAMEGFYVAVDGEARMCASLAESFPPRCGGPSTLIDVDPATLGPLESEGATTWSPDPVVVVGEFVDGVFVAQGG